MFQERPSRSSMVGGLHRIHAMAVHLTILPPPPPAPTMAWAATRAWLFRTAFAIQRLGRALMRRLRMALAAAMPEEPVAPEERRLSWFVDGILRERAARARLAGGEDRPTAVEVRRG